MRCRILLLCCYLRFRPSNSRRVRCCNDPRHDKGRIWYGKFCRPHVCFRLYWYYHPSQHSLCCILRYFRSLCQSDLHCRYRARNFDGRCSGSSSVHCAQEKPTACHLSGKSQPQRTLDCLQKCCRRPYDADNYPGRHLWWVLYPYRGSGCGGGVRTNRRPGVLQIH